MFFQRHHNLPLNGHRRRPIPHLHLINIIILLNPDRNISKKSVTCFWVYLIVFGRKIFDNEF